MSLNQNGIDSTKDCVKDTNVKAQIAVKYIFICTSDTKQGRIQDFRRRGANPPMGVPTDDFTIFSEKLHGIEKNLERGGGGGGRQAPR